MGKITKSKIECLAYGNSINGGSLHIKKLVNSTSFYAQFTIDGNRVHELLGKSSDGYNLTRARIDVNRLRSEIQDQGMNTQRKIKPMKFSDAADEYFNLQEETGGKNIKQKKQQFRDHLLPEFGKKKISELTTIMVQSYREKRIRAGRKSATVNREIAALNHFYSSMLDWGWIAVKPYNVQSLKEENIRIVYFTKPECLELLDAAKQEHFSQIWLFILVGLNTGMRHMEILSARFENIDFGNNLLLIPNAKAGPRNQPLPASVINALIEHRDTIGVESGWVFPSKLTNGHVHSMKMPFRKVVETIGLSGEKYTPHVMRYTKITRLMEERTPLAVVKEISGHKSLAMVSRYTHIANEHVTAAIESSSIG